MSMKKGVILLSIMMALALTLALAQPAPAQTEYQDYKSVKAKGMGYNISNNMCDPADSIATFAFKVKSKEYIVSDLYWGWDKFVAEGVLQYSDLGCSEGPCVDFYADITEIQFRGDILLSA